MLLVEAGHTGPEPRRIIIMNCTTSAQWNETLDESLSEIISTLHPTPSIYAGSTEWHTSDGEYATTTYTSIERAMDALESIWGSETTEERAREAIDSILLLVEVDGSILYALPIGFEPVDLAEALEETE